MTWEWESDRRENPLPTERPYSRTLPQGTAMLDQMMARYLYQRRLDYQLAVTNFWYGSYKAGDDSPRIVIPATSKIPGNVFWQARAMDDNPKRWQSPHAPRGDAVIVVWPTDRPTLSAVVEGPMDALAAAGAGVLGVALMGATPSQEALVLTATMIHGTICTVVADQDALQAAARWTAFLANVGVRVRMTYSAAYKDLADTPPAERLGVLSEDGA
jgi:hypothetical protein